MEFKQWKNFNEGEWKYEINVRDFIQQNYTPYEGNSDFLTGTTKKTEKLWNEVLELYKKEHDSKGGVLDIDTKTPSTITAHDAGYIDKDLEDIVGLQTDGPLKRAIMPFGGIRIVEKACAAYDKKVDERVEDIFTHYRKTHNDGVFDAYTPDIRAARKSHLITGLPDGYGRGRIIGDYRRVALYGVDVLIEEKQKELDILDVDDFTENIIREREEKSEQIKALNELKEMAQKYGFDISKPATNAKEAVQWLYFAYLGAIKSQDGAAMSLGRTSTFLDIYFERDLKEGTLTEEEAQNHPKKNILMRALGANNPAEVDIFDVVDEEIEGIFLCSDGLTSMLNQTQIEKVLDGSGSLEEKVTRLIRKSNVRGGTDNISIACLMYNDEEGEL